LDADNDNRSNGSTIVQCVDPGTNYDYAGQLIGTTGDCDDNVATTYSGATELCNDVDDDCDGQVDDNVDTYDYYQDNDGDGYGNPAVNTGSCSSVTGYVLLSGDCNDTSTIYNPETVWYLDADADDYSEGSTQVQCADPGASYYILTDLSAATGDCDDSDATVYS